MSTTTVTTPVAPSPAAGVRYVSVAEYAELMNLRPRTVYHYIAGGRIPGVVQAGPRCAYRIPVAA